MVVVVETSATGSCVVIGKALSTSCDRSGATSVVSLIGSEFKFSNSGVTAGSGVTSVSVEHVFSGALRATGIESDGVSCLPVLGNF